MLAMSGNPLACIILAAGMGTRMKSSLPKVLHEVAGRPMIGWVIDSAAALKPEKIIVVTGPDMKTLAESVAPHSVAVQEKARGTGDAVRAALPALKGFEGDVLILLGDTPLITSASLKKLVSAKAKDLLGGLAVMGMKLKDPKGYGRLIVKKDGSLEKIVEEKDATAAEKKTALCNSGAFCVDGKRLHKWAAKITSNNAAGEYYITDLPEIAARDNASTHIYITPDAQEVKGCNTRGDLAVLEHIIQQRLREAHLNAGVTLREPKSVYFSYDTKIGRDCIIGPHVVFGPGVKIASGVEIKAFSHIEGAQIKKNASIGPFARLRPGARLEENVRIGNFVEVKNSRIGQGAKINHLAYVGDCLMGAETNFSAGAITVNYDGFQKHKTKIGKGVMVGSNVNLVAPVSIDDGAFIAAGSTITENVPANALSMERSKAEIRTGWAALYRKKKEKAKTEKKLKKSGA